MKWVGYLGLLFAVSFTVSLGLLSDNASANPNTEIQPTNGLVIQNDDGSISQDITSNFLGIVSEQIENKCNQTFNNLFENAMINDPDNYRFVVKQVNNHNGIGISQAVYVSIYKDIPENPARIEYLTSPNNSYFIQNYGHIPSAERMAIIINYQNDEITVNCTSSGVSSAISIGLNAFTSGGYNYIYYSELETIYPENYEGLQIPGSPAGGSSNWKPDIKLHQGSNWVVELSDYNFFTFDKVAFTCGEHELAPVINWEVWDITDDENRVLIDTLIYGAPALVKYQAPKIQEDKRYEIVAYYSDCEGYTFTEASTKQFTVRKDGSLNPTDYMNVCIMETFPFINIPDCMAEINDLLAVLSFRVPEVQDIGNPGGGGGGGGWAGLVDGCRELQVLDDWILSPDVVICPQMPSSIRNVVTPIVTFALALGVITFVVQRQGMRGISG